MAGLKLQLLLALVSIYDGKERETYSKGWMRRLTYP